jgi:DNA-binding NarL/FixJ family response regulator
MRIRILLADDHKVLRAGLRSLIEKESGFEIVGEAADGREAVRKDKELSPDLVIMDIGMPELNGIEATRQIRGSRKSARVLILSMQADRQFVVRAFSAGACGYLLKDCAFEELIQAIRVVMGGKPYVSPSISGVVIEDYVKQFHAAPAADFPELTDREREVLQLVAEGGSTKEIADHLKVSVKTVETHRQQIMKKLHLNSVAALTKYAIREGLTSLQ